MCHCWNSSCAVSTCTIHGTAKWAPMDMSLPFWKSIDLFYIMKNTYLFANHKHLKNPLEHRLSSKLLIFIHGLKCFNSQGILPQPFVHVFLTLFKLWEVFISWWNRSWSVRQVYPLLHPWSALKLQTTKFTIIIIVWAWIWWIISIESLLAPIRGLIILIWRVHLQIPQILLCMCFK